MEDTTLTDGTGKSVEQRPYGEEGEGGQGPIFAVGGSVQPEEAP